MRRSPSVAVGCVLTLALLYGCGAGVAPVGQPALPDPVSTQLPSPVGTEWVQAPQPVISAVPPMNSATAAVEATAVAQRTATAQAEAPTMTAIAAVYATAGAIEATAGAVRAPTLTAYAMTGDQPRSPRAEPGRAYPFSIDTHCGDDFRVDFDGSFWNTAERNYSYPTPTVGGFRYGGPQTGTMTLIDVDRARFDFQYGSIIYARHKGIKFIGTCA
jgi:hypothetical protein